MRMVQSNFLDMIKEPKDIKVLNRMQLKLLAGEIREEIIKTVSKNGGHLGPGLGVVELTLALHYVYKSPEDKIIWDVSHQCYPHKLLTGRRSRFHTLRQHNGLSGYARRSESNHDHFGAGHASTAISAALGMAIARDLEGKKNKIIAVVGDGALTGGMAFEGLNNAGILKTNILVILNDNGMSISPNVGGVSNYLQELIVNPNYLQNRKKLEKVLSMIPLGSWAKGKAGALEDTLRAAFSPGMLFRQFGFKYFGPINGHNTSKLIQALKNIKDIDGPVFLHVKTLKGKGYNHAENNKTKFHGLGPFEIQNGEKLPSKGPITYTEAFSKMLIRLAKKDDRIVAITAAMAPGTGLDKFAKEFPNRFFDVGIAEQHAVTFAGGLATQGLKPVVAIYSTFLQRAYDQVIHDICIQNLPVVFAIDRGGLVGDDGATHNGVFDLTYLRTIPNMVVMAPKDENELGRMLKTAIAAKGPIAIRYPRGAGEGRKIYDNPKPIQIGKAKILKTGNDILIIAIGTMVNEALIAAKELEPKIKCSVVNARFVKPLDKTKIISLVNKCKKIVCVEENVLHGGFGSAILELMHDYNIKKPIKCIGIPDEFVEHGKIPIIRMELGLDAKSIKNTILNWK